MCKWGSPWKRFSGGEEVSTVLASSSSSCLGRRYLREGNGYTVETFSTKPEELSIELRMCHSRFVRQKLLFLETQRSTLLWSTTAPASPGFHNREKGVWQVFPFFFSGMKPVKSVPQPVCWFLWIHPRCLWECTSSQGRVLIKTTILVFLIFCTAK